MMPVKSTLTTTRKVDPITLKEELEAGFPTYTVTYSVMADSFKLRNRYFRHTLVYNTDKPSKLESISLEMRRKVISYNLILCLLLTILVVGEHQFNQKNIFIVLSSDKFIFLSILFLGMFQYHVYQVQPELNIDLKREQGEVRERLKEAFV
jgi:hypothetical protein